MLAHHLGGLLQMPPHHPQVPGQVVLLQQRQALAPLGILHAARLPAHALVGAVGDDRLGADAAHQRELLVLERGCPRRRAYRSRRGRRWRWACRGGRRSPSASASRPPACCGRTRPRRARWRRRCAAPCRAGTPAAGRTGAAPSCRPCRNGAGRAAAARDSARCLRGPRDGGGHRRWAGRRTCRFGLLRVSCRRKSSLTVIPVLVTGIHRAASSCARG